MTEAIMGKPGRGEKGMSSAAAVALAGRRHLCKATQGVGVNRPGQTSRSRPSAPNDRS